MKADKAIKLSDKQRKVIECLRDGYSLVTSNDMKGAMVSNDRTKHQFHIDNGVFWRLVHKELIFQNPDENFYYTLTELGRTIQID